MSAAAVAGVVGWPVGHSLSPLIHNAWIKAAGLDAIYRIFPLEPDDFEDGIARLRAEGVAGVNVTIPFKERALALAGAADAAASDAGAANVLLFGQDGSVRARNTDGLGLLIALEGAGFRAAGAKVALIGAGGAARGAVGALLRAGVAEIRVLNRSIERAEALAELDPRVSATRDPITALTGAGAVINATSLGMDGHPPLHLPLDAAPGSAVVMDMVYRPLETPLLKAARQRGHPIADGLSMLVGQAVPSFEAFFGKPPPTDIDVHGLCLRALEAM